MGTKEKVAEVYRGISDCVRDRGYRTALLKDESDPDGIPALCFFKPNRSPAFCVSVNRPLGKIPWSLDCGGIVTNYYGNRRGGYIERIFWYMLFEYGKELTLQFAEKFDEFLISAGEQNQLGDTEIYFANPLIAIKIYADDRRLTVYTDKP